MGTIPAPTPTPPAPPPLTAEQRAALAEVATELAKVRQAQRLAEEREKAARDAEASRQRAELTARAAAERAAARAADMLRLGLMLEGQGKVRGALGYYRNLVDDYAAHPQAGKAAERIAKLVPAPDFGKHEPFPVIAVVDHMTFTIRNEGQEAKVRLHGLEKFPPLRPIPPGPSREQRAKEFLEKLLEGRSVHLSRDKGIALKNGEFLVAYVYRADDKLFVNREMIARGFACPSSYATFGWGEDFRDEGERAKERKVGVWDR